MKFARLSLCLSVASCSDIASPQRIAESLLTDSTSYTARYVSGEGAWRTYGFKVVTRFHNSSEDTLFLGRCYPDSRQPIYSVSVVEKSDSWGAAYNGVWACVGHENPITVPPNRTRIDTLNISGPKAVQGSTALGVFDGTFRVHFQVQTCRREAACDLRDAGGSNTFRVERELH